MSETSQLKISTEQRLHAYVACENAILTGHQSHTVEGVTYTRADLRTVKSTIEQLRAELEQNQSLIQRVQVVI